MYILTVEDSFASAHQLRKYKGKCENLHGHNWKVVLAVKGNTLDNIGLLVDFGDLKKMVKGIIEELDHKNLNDTHPFTEINPSSENIARYIASEAAEKIRAINSDAQIESVTVWESGTSRCTYIPE